MRLSWMAELVPRSKPSWLAPAPPAKTPTPSPPPVVEARESEPDLVETTIARDEEIAGLRAALVEALARVATLRAELIKEAEPQLVKLAIAIAERVIDGSVDPTRITEWARQGVAELASQGTVTVRVSPHLASLLPTEGLTNATLEIAPELDKWECIVEAATTRLNIGLPARLRTVVEALGGET